MTPRDRVVLLLAVVGACTQEPLPAQGVGIFLRHDRLAEYSAGAGLNLLSRGPWVAKGWRHPVVRLVGVQATSLAYERLFDYNGFNWSDYRQRFYGYAVTELGIELGRWALHRRRRH